MTDLTPASTYFYIVGDPITNLWSPEYTFETTPETIFHIVAYGDQGENQNSIDLLNLIISRSPNLVLHAGGSILYNQILTF